MTEDGPPEFHSDLDARGSVDGLYRALSDPQRRFVVSFLRDAEDPVALADLGRSLAAHDGDRAVSAVPTEDVQDSYLSLYHTHIPHLDEAGVVAFDRERNLVEKDERFEEAASMLETF